ncbi:hypothetical protein [Serratia sp. 2723]|uniref:hypothetical protein n=1 Tax=unclassified Serratia (in: enterobacteria) TaxID=2647522 RepID=UPI003D1BAAE8
MTDKLSIRGNLTLLALGGEFACIALRFFAMGKESDNGSGFGGNAVKWMLDVFSWCEFRNLAEEGVRLKHNPANAEKWLDNKERMF